MQSWCTRRIVALRIAHAPRPPTAGTLLAACYWDGHAYDLLRGGPGRRRRLARDGQAGEVEVAAPGCGRGAARALASRGQLCRLAKLGAAARAGIGHAGGRGGPRGGDVHALVSVCIVGTLGLNDPCICIWWGATATRPRLLYLPNDANLKGNCHDLSCFACDRQLC